MSESAPIDRLPTGIDGLDAVLNGGLLRGSAYIVHGPPGTGKTILSNQICFGHTSRGETALYVSLLAESHDRMMRFMQRMGFFMPEHVPERLVYFSAYSALQREGLAGVAGLIAAEMRKRKATLVIFDGLFVAQDAAVSEYSFREFVHELQGLASVFGATMLLLTNQRRDPSSPEYTMVDGWIELADGTHGLRPIRSLEVHKQRGGRFLRGRHFFRITEQGIRVFPRVETAYAHVAAAGSSGGRVTSGVAGLDAKLMGGYPTATATMLYGGTGVGKTTLGLHFVGSATPEAPALFYSFLESPARLTAKAAALGLDVERLVSEGALRLHWHSPAELLGDELIHAIIEEVRSTGAKLVFVDGLHALQASLVYPERLRLVINALNNCLQSMGVTSLYTLETRELYFPADLGANDLSAIVNNILLLHYAMRDGALRRNLTILKLRDSDFDPRSHEFRITDSGVVFVGAIETQEPPDGARPSLAASDEFGGVQPERSSKDR